MKVQKVWNNLNGRMNKITATINDERQKWNCDKRNGKHRKCGAISIKEGELVVDRDKIRTEARNWKTLDVRRI